MFFFSQPKSEQTEVVMEPSFSSGTPTLNNRRSTSPSLNHFQHHNKFTTAHHSSSYSSAAASPSAMIMSTSPTISHRCSLNTSPGPPKLLLGPSTAAEETVVAVAVSVPSNYLMTTSTREGGRGNDNQQSVVFGNGASVVAGAAPPTASLVVVVGSPSPSSTLTMPKQFTPITIVGPNASGGKKGSGQKRSIFAFFGSMISSSFRILKNRVLLSTEGKERGWGEAGELVKKNSYQQHPHLIHVSQAMEDYYDEEEKLSTKLSAVTIGKELAALAAPTAFMITVGFATQGITVAFIGQRLGTEAIGHFSIGNSVFNLFGISIGFGLTAALDTLVSQSFGRHKQDSAEIGEYIQRATLINVLLTIPVGIIFVFGEPIFSLMFGDAIGGGVASYTRHTVPYMLLYLIAETFIKVFQAIDEPNLPFAATVVSAVACWFFNYFFMFGDFVAAAWVMTATYFVQVVALVGICFLHPRITFWRHCKWFDYATIVGDGRAMREYFGIGIPSLLACIAEWWAFEVVQIIAAGISIKQVAALNITMNVSGLLFSLSLGVCTAASVKVGNALGENKPFLAKRLAKIAILFDQLVNCCTCSCLLLFRHSIGPLFTTESEMVDEFCFLAIILAVYHWGDSTQIAIQGVFRGVGKQGQAVYPVLLALWFVGLPLCYVFGRSWKMDAGGIMLGLIVGFAVEIPLLLRCLRRWDWRQLAAEASHQASANSSPISIASS